MPDFRFIDLSAHSHKVLKNFCKEWATPSGSRKNETICNLKLRAETIYGDESEFAKKKRQFSKNIWPNPSPIHQGYVENFNLIDLANRQFYSTDEKHAHHSWKIRMTLALLRFAIQNCFALSGFPQLTPYVEWRRELAAMLVKDGCN